MGEENAGGGGAMNLGPPGEPPEKEAPNGAAGAVLAALGLKWIRPLLYNLGGRKVAVGGGALAVMSQVVSSNMADWPKAIACVAVAVLAVGTSLAIGMEDNRKEAKEK